MNLEALYKISYGLYILTAREGEKDNGCIVNTVMQITDKPNRIAVAVNKSNYTHGMIERTGMFNVSVLSERSRFETYRHWGFQSGAQTDKAQKISFRRAENGVIFLEDECNAYLCATVISSVDMGTHTVFFGEVTDCAVLNGDASVTYAYYHKNIKPAPPVSEKKKGYICTICGYIYEGEPLPEDFICPWCKHPASDFKPL